MSINDFIDIAKKHIQDVYELIDFNINTDDKTQIVLDLNFRFLEVKVKVTIPTGNIWYLVSNGQVETIIDNAIQKELEFYFKK